MVSGLITGPGGTPQSIFVCIHPSSTEFYSISLLYTPPMCKLYTSTTLAIFHGDGTSNMSATAFASLGAANGCSLSKVSTTATAITVGDRVLCKTTWYVNGSQYQISDGTTLLATGKFH